MVSERSNQGDIVVFKEEMTNFLSVEFPQTKCLVETVGDQSAVVRHPIGFNELRPGGTVAGPVLMTVADVALYVALLGEIGLLASAVTTNLSMNFLRKPVANKDIIAKCKLIKVGRTQAVGEVSLYSEGDSRPVAHAVGTYALPERQN